jgi:hypothetical protein
MTTKKYWAESWLFVFCIICLISFPVFFDIYRMLAFNTTPRDDYAPFLLWFVSRQGRWPGSPFGYRVLSIIPAIPLFYILPFYKFSLLPGTNLTYLKATEALSAVSFLATAGAATVAFKMVRSKLGRGLGEAAFAAMLTIALAHFDGIGGVDPVGVLFVFVLLYCFERGEIFCPLVIVAPFANEKTLFFFLFLVAGRLIFVPSFWRSHIWQIAAVVASLATYIIVLKFSCLLGNEGQTELGRRLPLLLIVSKTSVSSLKGVVRNIVPVLIFAAPCLWFALRKKEANGLMTASDLAVPLGMLLVGLSFTEGVQVGRIVSYAMPLTIIAGVTLLGERDDEGPERYCIQAHRSGGVAEKISQSTERLGREEGRQAMGSGVRAGWSRR